MNINIKLLQELQWSAIFNHSDVSCHHLCIALGSIPTQTKTMRADSYPPINVLSVFRGIQSQNLPYHIIPYRFEKQNGQAFKIELIRHFHQDRKGKGRMFHYVVKTEGDSYFRILFDTNTFTWRLIEEVSEGVIRDAKQQ